MEFGHIAGVCCEYITASMSVKRILISQPKPESGKSPYIDIAAKHGAEITFRSFITTESVTAREFRDQRINILAHSAVIFTTRKAMEYFFQLASELRLEIPETMKYFCIHEQIANYLQKFIVYRKRKVFFPSTGTLDGLVALIAKHNKETYFIPAPEEHKTDLQDLMAQKRIEFSTGIMFRTVPQTFVQDDRDEPFDMLILFTPVGVRSLKVNYPEFVQGDIKIAAQGSSTIQAIEEAGLRLDLTTTAERPSMMLALDRYLAEVNKD